MVILQSGFPNYISQHLHLFDVASISTTHGLLPTSHSKKGIDCNNPSFQGIYLLTTLVQLGTMFPPTHSSSSSIDGGNDGDVNLFSSLPQYSLFGGLFDWSFLFGASGCALARWAGGLFNGDVEDYA